MKKLILILFLFSILLTSCSGDLYELGLLSDRNTWLAKNINSFSDFFKTFLVLQLSIFITSMILSIFLKKIGYYVSMLIHFIWIVWFRDYGFMNVFILFSLPIIFNLIFSFLILKSKNK